MNRYIVNRILLAFPTIIGAAIVVFFLLRVIPGDVCEVKLLDMGLNADMALIEVCRKSLNLDQPLAVQFARYMEGLLTFDLGESLWTGKPVSHEIELRFALSLQLTIMATAVSIVIAIPLGILSATHQDTWIDYTIRTISIAGVAVPAFWLGIIIIMGLLIFSQKWFGDPWMPPIEYVSFLQDPVGNLSQLIWPAMAVGYRYAAVLTRMTRSSLLEVIREDYVRTARAKGLGESTVIQVHALKNMLFPVLTLIGTELAFLMGGLVVTEQVFNLNGLGRLLLESVLDHDYNITLALVMIVVAAFVIVNLLVDLLYAWLDPRIRYD